MKFAFARFSWVVKLWPQIDLACFETRGRAGGSRRLAKNALSREASPEFWLALTTLSVDTACCDAGAWGVLGSDRQPFQ